MNVTGNFRALVVNNTDPERRARIQVQVPQLMGQAVSGWALPIPADAIVPPRVGSQVIVTFEGGDLSQPLYFATGVGSGGGGGGGSATTHYQSTEPTGLGEENHGEMWVNSDDLSIWVWNWSGDSGTWIRVAGTAVDIDAALLAALENGLLSEMRQQVDGMIETFYGPAEPVEPNEGDLWLDTTDPTNTILKRYNGAGWAIFENPRIQQAYQIAGTAAATADGKVRTFAQDEAPEDMVPEDVGDLWIDTNDGNKLYRWDGVEWVPLRDASIQDALDRANESIKDSQIEYAVNTSVTVPPDPETGGWSTDTPVHTPGTYVWMRTRLTKGDDSFKYSSPVLVTGNDGATGRSIDHVDVEFYLSTSFTELLGGDWFTDAPVWVEGTYLWTRTRVVYTDGGEDVSDAAMISGIDGIDGMDGRGITSVVEQYYLSTSSTQLSGGSWDDTPPEWVEGMYFWTRSVITYTSGSPHTTDPMMVSGSQGQPGISITAVVPHFYRQPKDDPAPDKPTVKNPSGWTTTEPTWVEDTALYRAERVDYSTGDFAWTDVSPVSAWNAASSALSAAAEAKAVANQAAADLITLSGRTGRLIRSPIEPTATLDKDPNNLWLNTSTGQLYEYDPLTGWELITDERLTEAIEAADQAANHAAAAAQSAADAVSLAEAAEQAATAASGHASTAQAAALQSASDAAAAEAASTSALASASAAQTAANTAAQDAADAALAAVGPALDDIASDAAADATAKAAAAEQAAKDHADAVAEAERLAAIAAASDDATDKAAAAQAAAEATAAADAADKANAALEAAKLDATAKADAAAAIANSKADVLIQPTAPAAAMRKATTLWIDTKDGANTPKRWDGSKWAVVTDKAAKDAAQAAVDAQEDADQALQEASDLRTRADALEASALAATDSFNQIDGRISTLDGKVTVAYSNPTTADALGKPEGAIWEVHSGGTALRRFILTAGSGGALSWVQARIGQDFIGVNAIGQAQIIDAAVGTAQIGDAAITNAKIGKLAVDTAQIKDAAITNAKIDNLAVTTAKIKDAAITTAKIENLAVETAKIKDGAITNVKIGNATIEAAKIKSVNADTITTGTLGADRIGANSITAEKLLIAPGNIFPDPLMQNTNAWPSSSNVYLTNHAGHPLGRGLRINSLTTQIGAYYGGSNNLVIPIEPGAKYRVRATVYVNRTVSDATQRLRVYFRGMTTAGAQTITSGELVPDTDITYGAAAEFETEVIAPSTSHGLVAMGFHTGGPYSEGVVFVVNNVSVLRMSGSTLIENGAITTDKLNTGAIQVGHFAEETRETISSEITSATGELGSSLSSEFTEALDSLPFSDYTPVETFNTRTGDIDTAISAAEQAAADNLNAARTELDEQIETINTTLAENKLYIDINPTDGIRLGHVDNSLNVKITNDRLSFLEGNTEVAYISNQKLYITTAEVTDQLVITRPGLDSSFYFDPRDNGNLSFRFRNN